MKKKGFTLIEVLVSITLLIVFIGFIFQFSQSIQLAEKRLRISKEFQRESRSLLDKLVSVTQNNIVDYDRYFKEMGPDSNDCTNFNRLQLPKKGPTEVCSSENTTLSQNSNCINDLTNRNKLNYSDIFYWDTNNDNIPERQLGGYDKDGLPDPCTTAFISTKINDNDSKTTTGDKFKGENSYLFLINNKRTRRFAFRLRNSNDICPISTEDTTTNCAQIVAQIEFGADTNNDGRADIWSNSPEWENNTCKIQDTQILDIEIDTESKCLSMAHDWSPISLSAINIQALNFEITPNKDPYLAYRDLLYQKHSSVKINLRTNIKNPEKYSFEIENSPKLNLQTSVSSRVYGNSREK